MTTTTEITVGQRVTGRCVTMFTEHTGEVTKVEVSARFAGGAPREYRVTIQDETTGRPVILWTGTERVA